MTRALQTRNILGNLSSVSHGSFCCLHFIPFRVDCLTPSLPFTPPRTNFTKQSSHPRVFDDPHPHSMSSLIDLEAQQRAGAFFHLFRHRQSDNGSR